jgi:hypothetical protein
MRPLVWWAQDHKLLTAAGIGGSVAAIVVVLLLLSGGGSSPTPAPAARVASSAPKPRPRGDRLEAGTEGAGKRSTKASAGEAAVTAGGAKHRAARRRRIRHAASPSPAKAASGPAKASHPTEANGPAHSAPPPAAEPATKPRSKVSGGKAIDQATAERVAAEHPGVGCPTGMSREECERAVEAGAEAAPSTPVASPADCAKAMSAADCEEIFAEEEAARANGTPSIAAQECLEQPELAACAGMREQMETQYEALHPGG